MSDCLSCSPARPRAVQGSRVALCLQIAESRYPAFFLWRQLWCVVPQDVEADPSAEGQIFRSPAQKVSPASSWQVVGRNGGSPAAASYAALGIVSTVTDSIVEFAYSAQCRTDRHGQPRYIDCLEEIYRTRDSPSLQHFWATEKSKGVWGESDLEKAYELFGFGSHNGMETDMPQIPSEVPETMITDAFATRFIEAEGDPARRSELKDAVEVIAKARKSELIRASVASLEMEASKPKMTAERAYQVLETHESYDDDMLIALYDIRVRHSPGY